MKTTMCARSLLLIALIFLPACIFSGSIVNATVPTDTLVQITAGELRATCRIFVEHKHLKAQNGILTEGIRLLEQKTSEYENIFQLQQKKIDNMTQVEVKYQQMLTNHREMIRNMEIKMKQDRKKYIIYGGAAGIVITSLLFALVP